VQTETVITLPIGDTTLVASASSSVGSVRSVNEDSFLTTAPLFVVADGMGGHARGDRASQTVVAVLRDMLPEGVVPRPADVLAAITAANKAVRALMGDDGRPVLSGTTLVGMVIVRSPAGDGCHWMGFNIGDSRLYSWNGRTLDQVSVDHSAVQEMVDAGSLTPAAARSHPGRNVITRAVGADDTVDADVWLLPLRGAQTFLLCSDGLTTELDDDTIAGLLAGHGGDGPDISIADALVAAADTAGGRDNITVVVVDSSVAGARPNDENTTERSLSAASLEDTQPRI
jgi:serine/threonine protein phosphatase PrpC